MQVGGKRATQENNRTQVKMTREQTIVSSVSRAILFISGVRISLNPEGGTKTEVLTAVRYWLEDKR